MVLLNNSLTKRINLTKLLFIKLFITFTTFITLNYLNFLTFCNLFIIFNSVIAFPFRK